MFKSLTSPEPSEPSRSRAERAYLNALYETLGQRLQKGETLQEDSYLEDGRAACELAADEDAAVMVEEILEPVEGDRDVYRAALTRLCPKHARLWRLAATGFGDGTHTVGKDVRPGSYRTLRRPVSDCYWERSTGSGRIIANQLVTNAPRGVTVTVQVGEGFTSRDCGPWIRA